MKASMNNTPRLLLILLILFALMGCEPKPAVNIKAGSPVAVKVQVLIKQSVQDLLELDGTVAPMQQADLVARVSGTLLSVNFKDGQPVSRNQVLFTLERGPYLQQLKLNQAKLNEAKSQYSRQKHLLAENATSQASVDSALSDLLQSQANVELARINLDYTVIRAPFDGVIGKRQVDAGNYVVASTGATVLGTIMTVSPAYVNAAVGEQDALRIRQQHGALGASQASAVGSTLAFARLQGERKSGSIGVLDFVDHQLNPTSGTLAVRGRFANVDNYLVSGMYAKLVIDLGSKRDALLIPRDALSSDQRGEFVYVVDDQHIAHRKPLITVPSAGEEREIISGLRDGERVVTAGGGKLSEGQQVLIQSAATAEISAAKSGSGS